MYTCDVLTIFPERWCDPSVYFNKKGCYVYLAVCTISVYTVIHIDIATYILLSTYDTYIGYGLK